MSSAKQLRDLTNDLVDLIKLKLQSTLSISDPVHLLLQWQTVSPARAVQQY